LRQTEPTGSVVVFGLNDMEQMMAEHRKTARSRKTATRKTESKRQFGRE
jgi:hypothetical protein